MVSALTPLRTVPSATAESTPVGELTACGGGVNTNILSPPTFIDEPSGNGAVNGIPVTVAATAT